MVLCTQIRLYSLSLRCGTRVDMFSGIISADERDRLDGRMVADAIDSIGGSVYPSSIERILGIFSPMTYTLRTPGGIPKAQVSKPKESRLGRMHLLARRARR